MKLTLAIFAILSTIAAVAAVDVRGFRNFGCWGHQYVCYNIPSGACCRFPRMVRSMRWTLPLGTRGTGNILKSCHWNYAHVYGPRYNSCFNYHGLGVRSGRWQQGTCVWTFRRSVLFERQDETCTIDEGCSDPTVLVYTTETGQNRTVVIPDGKAESVAQMEDNGDYKGLASLVDFGEKLDNSTSVDYYDLEETKEGEVL